MQKIMKNTNGFTLAEVLITLTIIGVIAAMTLPTLIANNQNQANYVGLKKNYSVLSNSYSLILAEYGTPDDWDSLSHEDIVWVENAANYFLANLKPIKTCVNATGCFGTKVAKQLNGKTTFPYADLKGIGTKTVSAKLADGTNLCFNGINPVEIKQNFGIDIPDSRKSQLVIYADVNGDKGPNTVGRDIFAFVPGEKGLLPAGNDYDENTCNLKNNFNYAGVYCTSKVLKEGKINY